MILDFLKSSNCRTLLPGKAKQHDLFVLVEGKTIPLQPLGLQEVGAPRIFRESTLEGGKIFSLKHQPPLPPRDIPDTHFC